MNPFTKHELTHLSPSQITTFSMDPSLWLAQKLFGLVTPTSPAAMRGRAVENGVAAYLTGKASLPEAEGMAVAEFVKASTSLVGGMADPAIKEMDGIPDMVALAVKHLDEFGTPEFPEEGQHSVALPVRFGPGEDETVELRGFLDFVYPDKIIDLKTTLRMPSEMTWNHRTQAAIYQRATGKPVKFAYVTPKRFQMLELTPEEYEASLVQVRTIVKRMACFLSLGDRDTLREAVPIIMGGWGWNGIEDQRLALLGI